MPRSRRLLLVALALSLALPTAVQAAAPAAVSAAPAVRAPAGADAAAREAVAALPRATAVNDADGNKLFDDLDLAYAGAAGRRLRVVVSFVEGTATGEGVARVLRTAPGAPVHRRFTVIPAYAGELDVLEARRVAALPEVRQVELDREGTPELDTARAVMGADAVVETLGVTGSLDGMEGIATPRDVGIAVLDSGFHVEHEQLAGKLVGWRDFGTNREAPYDPNGHGTHVANIAAGWGRVDGGDRGVAPGASVIGIKIDGGGTTQSNAMAGYEWIIANRDDLGIRVSTISYGFGTATDGTTALERTIDRVWEAGIVSFKSNGNSGPGRSTMTVPAAARGILAIGSMLDPEGSGGTKHGFVLSEYSSRGPTSDGRIKPDLVAPGESIRAARTGTTNGYIVYSGTSMASPFAAGTAALMIAADPTLRPDDVRSLLVATAEDWGPTGPDNDFGHGRIRVWDAVQAARARTGAAADEPSPVLAPKHEARTATPTNGVYETTFTVTDTRFPVAATVLSDQLVAAVDILDAGGTSRAQSPTALVNAGDRQHHLTFRPAAPGTYRLRAVVAPGRAMSVDLSHSLAE